MGCARCKFDPCMVLCEPCLKPCKATCEPHCAKCKAGCEPACAPLMPCAVGPLSFAAIGTGAANPAE